MIVYSETNEETTELEKEILKAPTLPNHVQGDGRYLMSLLKSFLEQTATQVNLANGFTADEIDPTAGKYITPKNFFLSFTRLGGQLSWNHLNDVSELAFYEVRENQDFGNNIGLLERTLENFSWKLPVTYVGTVYLYAANKDGEYSAPAVINYTKPRPDAPTNITITKTSEGTLISFSEIPSNCIGANIYLNGKQYQSQDNLFLLKETVEMERIEVAFYDQFGEGERGVLYLILPDVTGFLVERNGSELDFYWDAVNIYNIKYVVKISQTLSWEEGIELFRTATNDKNRIIYPKRGEYYLMVKAYDENGNYSKNAAYQFMTTESDISRNVILEFDQRDVFYNGTKINVFYDPLVDGVTLDREATKGEYLFDVQLDQNYRARNWLEFDALSVSNTGLTWEDATIAWEDAKQPWAGIIGNVDSTVFKSEIALKRTVGIETVFAADLNGDLTTEKGTEPFENKNADSFSNGRWALGLDVSILTKLAYDTGVKTNAFSLVFFLKTTKEINDTIILSLSNENDDYLTLGYDKRLQQFYLRASDGQNIFVPYKTKNMIEYFIFGVIQGENDRTLYIYPYTSEKTLTGQINAKPLGVLDKLYCYPKIIFKEM